MFKNTYQHGLLSILYSIGSHPLAIWEKEVKNGHIRRLTDEDLRSLVIEIIGINVATTFISCPMNPRQTLGIRLPFVILIVKNMNKYFTFQIQILDDKNMYRRFRFSNFQSSCKVQPFCTTIPCCLRSGWNQIQFNLSDFTKKAYGTNFMETTRVQIHANVRIRRIYFSDRLYADDEMPREFRLFPPPIKKKPYYGKTLKAKSHKVDKSKQAEAKMPPVPSEVDEDEMKLTAPTVVSLPEEATITHSPPTIDTRTETITHDLQIESTIVETDRKSGGEIEKEEQIEDEDDEEENEERRTYIEFSSKISTIAETENESEYETEEETVN